MSEEPEDLGVDLGAVEAAVATLPKFTSAGTPTEMDSELDAAIDAIPDALKDGAGFAGKKKEKTEQPSDPETEPADVGAEKKAESSYELEKALSALRLDNVPSETIDALLQNPKGRAQLLAWGAKANARQSAASEKLQKQAEDLKRAQEPKSTATETAPVALPDIDAALQAFGEFGDDFKKPMGEFGRAAIKVARDSVFSEIQPLVGVLVETVETQREMLNEFMRRDLGERFPKVIGDDARYGEAEKAFKRLWGENGATYQDAAASRLGRMRACWNDAARISEPAESRKDDAETKARRVPASPARSIPKKPPTVDAMVDEEADAALKRWEGR